MKSTFILASAVSGLFAITATASAETLVGDTFERDPVNPSPRVAMNADPSGWMNEFDDSPSTNGLADISVENLAGPRGGSRTMLVFDNNEVDRRIAYNRPITPTSSSNVQVTIDFRVNRVVKSTHDKFALRLFATTGSGVGFELSANGTTSTLDLYPISHIDASVLQTIKVGSWYRLTLLVPSVASGSSDWQMSVFSFANAASRTHQLTRPDAAGGGYSRLYLQSGYSEANTIDINLDNVTVETVTQKPKSGR